MKIGREVFNNAEDYSLIAYNFITGGKKGDRILDIF